MIFSSYAQQKQENSQLDLPKMCNWKNYVLERNLCTVVLYCIVAFYCKAVILTLQVVPIFPEDWRVAGLRLLYDISFFIIVTTIGLNIIFGIIVDTFSELREERVSLGQ